MSTSETPKTTLLQRPKRADARRNYNKVIAAAREAFNEGGASTSLEDIARRAGVGIGTLYRHFPTRQVLIEAVYVNEVEELARSAEGLEALEPWDALVAWLRRFVGYLATKKALLHELLEFVDRDAPLFTESRALMFGAGEPLLRRAQEAGVVREDTEIAEVTQLVMGIARIPTSDPGAVAHILDIAIDGLRYRG